MSFLKLTPAYARIGAVQPAAAQRRKKPRRPVVAPAARRYQWGMKFIDVPPVWLVFFATLAWFQGHFYTFGLSIAGPFTSFLAGLLIGGGVVLIGLAFVEFRKYRTTVIPHETPTHLIQTGIFKRSRNPIYLGDALILAGLILWWDAVLSLVFVPVFVWVIEKRFVVPEENRMRREFRADFARYAQKTRRWL